MHPNRSYQTKASVKACTTDMESIMYHSAEWRPAEASEVIGNPRKSLILKTNSMSESFKCSNMDFNEFTNVNLNNNSEELDNDKSHSKVRECIFKVFPKVSEKSKAIWIEIKPKGLQTLTLTDGLEFHILSTSRGQKLTQKVKQKFKK